MVFITVLLSVFAYIFAVFGVIFFRSNYEAATERGVNLRYPDSFACAAHSLSD